MNLIDIELPDGTAEAYLTGSGPGVLFFIDAIGLRPQIARMADRIAALGLHRPRAQHPLPLRDRGRDLAGPGGPAPRPGLARRSSEHVGPRIGALTPDA